VAQLSDRAALLRDGVNIYSVLLGDNLYPGAAMLGTGQHVWAVSGTCAAPYRLAC